MEKKAQKKPHVAMALIWPESKIGRFKKVREEASGCKKGSRDIEAVIYQSSCFSKTSMMKITPPSDHLLT